MCKSTCCLFHYCKKNENKKTIFRCAKWKKTSFDCKATAFVAFESDPPQVLKQEHDHNHGPDVLSAAVRDIENRKIKAAAEAGTL